MQIGVTQDMLLTIATLSEMRSNSNRTFMFTG